MFTGIINHLGTVQCLKIRDKGGTLTIECPVDTSDLKIGDSVSINGVCLTLTHLDKSPVAKLSFDLGTETLAKTTLSYLENSQAVHVEKAMRLADRLGGHLVQGHVDGPGILTKVDAHQDATIMRFSCSADLFRFCISKGSITIDGVSLTINELWDNEFEVCLIPHTLEKTSFSTYKLGQKVNLETDLTGKYIAKFMQPHLNEEKAPGDLWSKSSAMNQGELR